MKFVEVKPGCIINTDTITIMKFHEKSKYNNEAYAKIYFVDPEAEIKINADEYEKLKFILGWENKNGCS